MKSKYIIRYFSQRMANILVVGAGVVGRTTGIGFSELGHNVIFHDIVEERMLELKEKGFKTASNIRDAISQSDFSFVCVDTPNREIFFIICCRRLLLIWYLQ